MPDRIDIGAFEYVNENAAPVADAGDDLTAECGANCFAAVTNASNNCAVKYCRFASPVRVVTYSGAST